MPLLYPPYQAVDVPVGPASSVEVRWGFPAAAWRRCRCVLLLRWWGLGPCWLLQALADPAGLLVELLDSIFQCCLRPGTSQGERKNCSSHLVRCNGRQAFSNYFVTEKQCPTTFPVSFDRTVATASSQYDATADSTKAIMCGALAHMNHHPAQQCHLADIAATPSSLFKPPGSTNRTPCGSRHRRGHTQSRSGPVEWHPRRRACPVPCPPSPPLRGPTPQDRCT